LVEAESGVREKGFQEAGEKGKSKECENDGGRKQCEKGKELPAQRNSGLRSG